MIRINLNECVKVKLTDLGRDIYYHRFGRTNVFAGREVCKPSYPIVDKDGYTSFQLWHFINIFGGYIGLAKPNVILPLEIVYEGEAPDVNVGEWILCSERLPEDAGMYLVSGGNKIWISQFNSFGIIAGWIDSVKNPTIEAWMPLPDPFEGSTE